MNKNTKAWSFVSTLFSLLAIAVMFTFAIMLFLAPILSITTDWAWARDLTALFWELGLYK